MGNSVNICRNCFSELNRESGDLKCSVCGWDNSREQLSEALSFDTVLNYRYVIGRVKSMNGEGITYSAFDNTSRRMVEVREFFPVSIVIRDKKNGAVIPMDNCEDEFSAYLEDFRNLSKTISRINMVAVVCRITDVFEENHTSYAVYEYVPSITLHRFVENRGGRLSWNEVNKIFMPALTALGSINALGISHLGISPETLRVTKSGEILITGFCINASRVVGTPIIEEMYAGCAALEQYRSNSMCGELSDVYAFAATIIYALTGQLPNEATRRAENPRLMITKEAAKDLPSYAISALANALQVEQGGRTGSFERLRMGLTSSSTVITEIERTGAIRKLPPINQDIPQNKGLPPFVWLIASCIVTLVALLIIGSVWLKDSGKTFDDIKNLFVTESVSSEKVTVPEMTNQNYDEWKEKADNGELDFKIRVASKEFSDTVAQGDIISQSPFANGEIEKGETVVVTVSRGSEKRTLPEIKGMTFAEIAVVLTNDGFIPIMVEEKSDDVEGGYVVGYKDAKEGDSLSYGSEVTIIVSTGAEE